jgi:hypothetical protein
MQPKDLINHHQYPIDELAHPRRRQVIQRVRAELESDGCALLREFLSEAGLSVLLGEALERRPKAFFSEQKRTNAYLNNPDENLPDDHPVNVMMDRTNGFVTSDNFGKDTLSRQLYYWEPLGQLIRDCLGKDELFIYADPVSNMIVNVGAPGSQFNWHFDTNEFTITMLLKPASSGGYFEYAPGIRTADNENYDEVGKVLDGSSDRVKRLDLNPGDMQLFLGRFSLHQVTQNTGDDDRLLLIMSFAEEPEMVGNRHRIKQLYGKTMAVHENQQARTDGLRD